ncbi:MAG: metal-dependent hydrolase [Nanopusillaceae archaeon]
MIVKLHISVSLVISYLIYFLIMNFDRFSSLLLSLVTAKLSTLPDFDYKIFSWSNKQILMLKNTKLYLILFPYYFLLIFLNRIFKHRGITHSIYPILFFLILKFLFSNIFLILAFSFALHVLEDMFTVSGVQIFYPLNNFKLKIPLLNNKNREKQNILSAAFLVLFFIVFLLL